MPKYLVLKYHDSYTRHSLDDSHRRILYPIKKPSLESISVEGFFVFAILVLLSHTDKIFLKTPLSTRFWLESVHFNKMIFEWSHEIINIFPDEYLEDEITSFF